MVASSNEEVLDSHLTDVVFRALSDPSRRLLLDELHRENGQTLSALCQRLPLLSRFGVMKHLKVLEDAGLVNSTRRGRFRYHFLNCMPIEAAFDAFVRKYMSRPLNESSGSIGLTLGSVQARRDTNALERRSIA